jgi:hypothetical protein
MAAKVNLRKTKVCAQCRLELPVSEFYKERRYGDGLKARCKKCNWLKSNREGKPPTDETKVCSKCKEEVNLNLFYKRGKNYKSECTHCEGIRRGFTKYSIKNCITCKIDKPLKDYYKERSKYTEDGMQDFCIDCRQIQFKPQALVTGIKKCYICKESKSLDKYYPKKGNPDNLRGECIECSLKLSKKLIPSQSARDRDRCRKHGITVERYYEMLEAQSGGCRGCGMTPEENGRALAIDHRHSHCPGRYSCGSPLCIRGLLCQSCNYALGNIKDRIEVLDNLKIYLKEFE